MFSISSNRISNQLFFAFQILSPFLTRHLKKVFLNIVKWAKYIICFIIKIRCGAAIKEILSGTRIELIFSKCHINATAAIREREREVPLWWGVGFKASNSIFFFFLHSEDILHSFLFIMPFLFLLQTINIGLKWNMQPKSSRLQNFVTL